MSPRAPRIAAVTIAVLALGATALTGAVAAESSCTPGPRADCSGANLAGMDLAGDDLRGIDLSRASLIGADLSGANLTGADLRGADVMDATIDGANLTGADLTGADFTGTDLQAATTTASTTCPDGVAGPCNGAPADADVPDVADVPEGGAAGGPKCTDQLRPDVTVTFAQARAVGGLREVTMNICTGSAIYDKAREVFLSEWAWVYSDTGRYGFERLDRTLLYNDGKDRVVTRKVRCDHWYMVSYTNKAGKEYLFWGAGWFFATCGPGPD